MINAQLTSTETNEVFVQIIFPAMNMAPRLFTRKVPWNTISRRCYYTNVEAAQLIKKLYSKRSSSRGFPSKAEKAMLADALSIYGDIMEPPNSYVMNTMLSLMLHSKQSHEVVKLWQDLPRTLTESESPHSTFALMLKCFACSKSEDVDALLLPLLDTLEWIKRLQGGQQRLAMSQQEYSRLICRVISRFNVDRGTLRRIHSLIDDRFAADIFIETAVMNGYRKWDDAESAAAVFWAIPPIRRDAVCIGTMMAIYIEGGRSEEAMSLYDGIEAADRDHVHHCLALKACSLRGDLRRGNAVRSGMGNAVQSGRGAVDLQNALISFYGKCGALKDALDVFDSMPNDKKNVVTVGAMMAVFVDGGRPLDALQIYENVHVFNARIRRSEVCHVLALRSCVLSNELERGRRVVWSLEMDKIKDVNLVNAVISFYGHFQDVERALNAFKSATTAITIGTINAVMDCYFRSNLHVQCIELFEGIRSFYGLEPDGTSYSVVLAACALDAGCFSLGLSVLRALMDGDEGPQSMSMRRHLSVQIQSINLLAKMGRVEAAQQIFDDVKANEIEKYRREITVWNAMLNAFAINGDAARCKALFDAMVDDVGLKPIKKSYAILFNALSHCGDVQSALRIWKRIESTMSSMDGDGGNVDETKYDQYIVGSLVDGLSRKGLLMAAYRLILKYERFTGGKFNDVMWTSLLSGAVKHNKSDVARRIHGEYLRRFGDDEQYIDSVEAVNLLMTNL